MRWRPATTFRIPWHAERGLSISVIRSSPSASPGSPAPQAASRLNLASPPDNGYISASNPATLERLKSADADELQIWPNFLDEQEQRVLLGAALKKLDATVGGREERKRRREWIKREKLQGELVGFAPDNVYEWQDRHFDGVISSYRESTLSTWPVFLENELNEALAAILAKIYALLPRLPQNEETSASEAQKSTAPRDAPATTPPSHLLTHLLQLSSTGYILPHIDNIEASAGRILGVCLGAERELVLTHPERGGDEIRVRLPPGCAYMQSGTVRYDWKHAIPLPATDGGEEKRGQRLSVMIRDRVK